MRMVIVAVLACLLPLDAAFSQSGDTADNYYRSNVKPQLDAYTVCALSHLERRAKSDPTLTFEQIERSLRPACGANVDNAKEAMHRIGVKPSQANQLIGKWYTGIQGEIRTFYERVAAGEIRQREVAKQEVEKRRQELEVADERKKLMSAAIAEHNACLRREIFSIVPYSEESAETLGTVIMTKCSEHERKRVSLAVALFGVSRLDGEKMLKDISDETRKHIVAEIVTARAEIAKSKDQPGSGAPSVKTSPTI